MSRRLLSVSHTTSVLALILALLIVFYAAACQARQPADSNAPASQAATSLTETGPAATSQQTQATSGVETTKAPENSEQIDNLRYVLTNGMTIEDQQVTRQDNGVNIQQYYPQVSGIKNKAIADLLNNEIMVMMHQLTQDLEASVKAKAGRSTIKMNNEVTNAAIVYNYNNVIFVDVFAYLDATLDSSDFAQQKSLSFGMDLNTGRILQLKELFKNGSSYEELINNYLALYIIGNNFDDPDAQYMTKPFQGIRENQAFSFDLNGLRIIMDEKNDEFVNAGYTQSITIPLNVIKGELAIFDSFFDPKANLFTDKPRKQLLPNRLEYRVDRAIQDAGNNYSVNIEVGSFLNVVDPHLQNQLDQLISTDLDPVAYKQRAADFAKNHSNVYFGNMNHTVGLTMNAGGYLSILVYDVVYENEKIQDHTRIFNYDLNMMRPMQLSDLFGQGFDYRSAIATVLSDPDIYRRPDGKPINASDIQSLAEDDFYFDLYGVNINFNWPGKSKVETYVWIPFEKIGWENVALFN